MKDLLIRLRFEGRLDSDNDSRSYLIIRDETTPGDVSMFKGSESVLVLEEIMKVIEKYDK